MGRGRALRVLVLCWLPLALICCREEEKVSVGPIAPLPVPAAPSDLLASVVIARPQVAYTAWLNADPERRALPRQFPVLVAHVLGLPPLVSGRFLEHLPGVAAMAMREGEIEWALALRVASGAEFVAELTTGSNARFEAVSRGSATVLRGARHSFAIVDSTLILASEEAMLERYGPYLGRNQLPQTTRTERAPDGIVLTFSPEASSLVDVALERFLETFTSRARAVIDAETRRQGTQPELADPDQLIDWTHELASGLRERVRLVEGGRFELQFRDGSVQIEGSLGVKQDGVRSTTTSSACDDWLELRDGIVVAALLPKETFAPGRLGALRASLESESGRRRSQQLERGRAVEDFARGFEGPVLLALATHGSDSVLWLRAQWQTGTREAPVADGILSFLNSDGLRSLVGERSFPVSATLARQGFVEAQGKAEPAWQLAWASETSATSWVIGAGAETWLERVPQARVPHVFPAWERLCTQEPIMAFGLKHSQGDVAFAMTGAERKLDLTLQAPIALVSDAFLGEAPQP